MARHTVHPVVDVVAGRRRRLPTDSLFFSPKDQITFEFFGRPRLTLLGCCEKKTKDSMAPKRSAAQMAATDEASTTTTTTTGADVVQNETAAMNKIGATRIDTLQDHGVNATDIKKLRDAGICTVEGLQQSTKKEILEVKGTFFFARSPPLPRQNLKLTFPHSSHINTQESPKHVSVR
jgi:hypothetical protein